MRWKKNLHTLRRTRLNGRQNGNGMASGARSSNEMNELFVWSRGEELMTDKFPEYQLLTENITRRHCAGWRNLPSKEWTGHLHFNVLQTDRKKECHKKTIAGSADGIFRIRSAGIQWEGYPSNLPLTERRQTCRNSCQILIIPHLVIISCD